MVWDGNPESKPGDLEASLGRRCRTVAMSAVLLVEPKRNPNDSYKDKADPSGHLEKVKSAMKWWMVPDKDHFRREQPWPSLASFWVCICLLSPLECGKPVLLWVQFQNSSSYLLPPSQTWEYLKLSPDLHLALISPSCGDWFLEVGTSGNLKCLLTSPGSLFLDGFFCAVHGCVPKPGLWSR